MQVKDDSLRILMVEDVPTDAELALRELRRDGMSIDAKRVETREDFVAALDNYGPDIILSDFSLPKFDGFSALNLARDLMPDTPFMFVSGTIGEETAIAALKGGAIDYVLKTNLQRLAPAVRRAIEETRVRAARKQAEAHFHDLIEYAPHAIVVFDENGEIKIVNQEAEKLFGSVRDDLLGTGSAALVPQRFTEWHDVVCGKTRLAPGSTVAFEACGLRKDGIEFPADLSLSPLQTDSGLWVSTVIRDITERKAQEDRLARMTRIRTILGSINSVILRVRDKQRLLAEACTIAYEEGQFAGAVVSLPDENGQIKAAASAGLDLEFLKTLDEAGNDSAGERSDLLGQVLSTKLPCFVNEVRADARVDLWREAFIARGYRSLFIAPLMIGDKVIGLLSLFATKPNVFNEDEQRLLSELVGDISYGLDFIDKEEQINYLACFDSLTGFANRSLFQDRLSQLISLREDDEHRIFAIVLVDLERFRNINHTLGRAAGDEFLREVAQRLRECIPDSAYLARLHADWFAFILKDADTETEIMHWLDRHFTKCFAQPVDLQDEKVHIAMRAGIALYPADGRDADALLRNAEAAMKNAKAAKVRAMFYTAEMNARAAEKLSIESRLRRALEEEQFVLYYQPKLDLGTGKIAGLEALIRWDEPGMGIVLPNQFIHVLEETGLIIEVGKWVVERAHRQYQEWVAQGYAPPRIAVNVSQLQIRQKDFLSTILRTLESADPEELELEITESLLMDDGDENVAKRKLAALRETGVTVALDDFGTGYSSLSYIARLPIDTLKIDRSFITDITTGGDNKAIVSTIIALAHSLKFKVVAEGVETLEQEQLLRNLGCDQIQGFRYSHPLCPGELEHHFQRPAGFRSH